MARHILRLGVPISLTYGSEAGITSLAAVVMGTFGPIVLAAHNVVTQLTRIAFQISIGLSHGSSILISRATGKGDKGQAEQIAVVALLLGVISTVTLGLLYVVAPTGFYGHFRPRRFGHYCDRQILPLLRDNPANRGLHPKHRRGTPAGHRQHQSRLASNHDRVLVGWPAAMLLLTFPAQLHGAGVWIGLSTGFAATAALLLRRFRKDLPQAV